MRFQFCVTYASDIQPTVHGRDPSKAETSAHPTFQFYLFFFFFSLCWKEKLFKQWHSLPHVKQGHEVFCLIMPINADDSERLCPVIVCSQPRRWETGWCVTFSRCFLLHRSPQWVTRQRWDWYSYLAYSCFTDDRPLWWEQEEVVCGGMSSIHCLTTDLTELCRNWSHSACTDHKQLLYDDHIFNLMSWSTKRVI